MIATLTKKRVIRDFDKLDKRFKKKVLKSLPDGLNGDSITYFSVQGKTVAAIPFETEDTYYLFRLSAPKSPVRKRKQHFNEDYDLMDEMESQGNYYEKSGDDEQVGYDYHHSDDYDQEEDSDF